MAIRRALGGAPALWQAAAATTPALPGNRVTGALLLLAALGCAFLANRLARTRAQLLIVGGLPTLGLVVAGLVFLYSPAAADTAGPANPIPPEAQSVADGQRLYQSNCVPCHGDAGKGDGPLAPTLNPRPSDLSVHAAPGVHTDGQLYLWITNGFPDSAMPAFGPHLADRDRWDLVNYVRTLASP